MVKPSGLKATTSLGASLRRLGYLRVLFYVYLTVVLSFFAFLVPPFQRNDEPAHFHRSVSLTNLNFVCEEDRRGRPSFVMKRKYAELPEIMHTTQVYRVYEREVLARLVES